MAAENPMKNARAFFSQEDYDRLVKEGVTNFIPWSSLPHPDDPNCPPDFYRKDPSGVTIEPEPIPKAPSLRPRRTTSRRDLFFGAVSIGALVVGVAIGRVSGLMGSGGGVEGVPTAVATATIPQVETPKPAVVPGSPAPAPTETVIMPSGLPTEAPAKPAVVPGSPVPENKPAVTPVPKAPPVQSPVPEQSPTPRRILPKAPVGSLFDSQPQYRLASYIPEGGADLVSLDSITLGEVVSDVDNYRIPADLTDYVKNSVGLLQNDDGASKFADLMAIEPIRPLQDLTGGPELSLKGKLEGLIGNWMVNNPGDSDVTSFLNSLNRSDFFNLDKAVDDIQNGRFDPYNADHAKIVHLFTQQEPAGKAMLGLSYLEVKSQTEQVADVFSSNPDYFAQNAKVYFPKSIDDYSENGWFSKIKKCVNPSGPVI